MNKTYSSLKKDHATLKQKSTMDTLCKRSSNHRSLCIIKSSSNFGILSSTGRQASACNYGHFPNLRCA